MARKNFGYFPTDGKDNGLSFDDGVDYSLNTVSRVDENMLGKPIPKASDISKDDTKTTLPESSDNSDSTANAISAGKGLFKIIGGYMQSDAIRKKANYEADILQLNADFGLYEAGEQQGVDFSKIVRYGQEVEQTVGTIRAEFANLEQEGGAAADIISENTLQGKLNQLAMMNQAQASVSSAKFQSRLAYMKAENKRKLSRIQGRQATLAGYVGAAADGADIAAKALGAG